MIRKKHVGRLLFGIELVIFFAFYLTGSNGIMALLRLKKEIAVCQKNKEDLQAEVEALHKTIQLHQENSFFQEKFAREQLHMARPDEEIIYI